MTRPEDSQLRLWLECNLPFGRQIAQYVVFVPALTPPEQAMQGKVVVIKRGQD